MFYKLYVRKHTQHIVCLYFDIVKVNMRRFTTHIQLSPYILYSLPLDSQFTSVESLHTIIDKSTIDWIFSRGLGYLRSEKEHCQLISMSNLYTMYLCFKDEEYPKYFNSATRSSSVCLIEVIFIFQIIHSIIYLICKFDDNDVEMLFVERNTLSETECLVIPFSTTNIFVDLFVCIRRRTTQFAQHFFFTSR